MGISFRRVQVALACAEEDDYGPTVVQLTPRGDLVFHNWDRESDLIAEEMGFGTSSCLHLYRYWDSLHEMLHWPGDRESVEPLLDELRRVSDLLNAEGVQALSNASYGHPSGWSRDPEHNIVQFNGMGPSDRGIVSSVEYDDAGLHPEMGITRPVFNRIITTTLQAYMDVLNMIPSGLVLEIDPPETRSLAVAAVEEVLQPEAMVVLVGRTPHPFGGIETWRAIVVWDEESDLWLVDRWLGRV